MPFTTSTTAEMLNGVGREYMLLAGKDGAGKSSAIVSLAKLLEALNPAAHFHVIDTENKFATAVRSFGTDAPRNMTLYVTNSMNDVNEAWDDIQAKRKPGDWLGVESMGRIWERAQDMAYQAVSGFTKVQYLEKRNELAKKLGRAQAPVVIPKPDDFWNVAKGAHDSAFIDEVSQAMSLNVVLSTTMSKVKENRGYKENDMRKAVRIMFGTDMGLDGAPRLPTYVETTIHIDINEMGKVYARVLRDNLSNKENTRPTFDIADKKSFAMAWYSTCRV